MIRALTIATVLLASMIAFGGQGDLVPDVTKNAAAECLSIDGEECLPSPACIVAAVVQEVTGEPQYCTL